MNEHKVHIFDMDGLIINSEPFWREAEVKVFREEGIPFSESMCFETVGMRIDEVVNYWSSDYKYKSSQVEIAERIMDEVIRLIENRGEALQGIEKTLIQLNECDRICAVASSSSLKTINSVIDKLQLSPYFKLLHSAEFEKKGKPAPDVFLSVAKELNVSAKDCVVYEDSQNGMKAGLSAGMKVVLVPEEHNKNKPWKESAHLVLDSLLDWNLNEVENLF